MLVTTSGKCLVAGKFYLTREPQAPEDGATYCCGDWIAALRNSTPVGELNK